MIFRRHYMTSVFFTLIITLIVTMLALSGCPTPDGDGSVNLRFAPSYNSSQDFNTLDSLNILPQGIWSDGTIMWVADNSSQKIYAYNLSTKARMSGEDIPRNGATFSYSPGYIWSDGTTMWVTESVNGENDNINAYKLSDGTRDSSKNFTTLGELHITTSGIWSDGKTMWILEGSQFARYAYAYHLPDGSTDDGSADFGKKIDLGNPYTSKGMWSNGTTLWVLRDISAQGLGFLGSQLSAYDIHTRSSDNAKTVYPRVIATGFENAFGSGIWSDGRTMWIVNFEPGNSKIYAYTLFEEVE
ncbi:MAG: hypothetical protein ACR2PY_02140 [Salinispira sp.]